MNNSEAILAQCVVVESEVYFSLIELGRACRVNPEELVSLVHEGVLTASGADPSQWRFEGTALPRARAALRLLRDLELNAPGVALVLELFAEIDSLRSQLRRMPS
jgi:chaperone modulatory protein CbpM